MDKILIDLGRIETRMVGDYSRTSRACRLAVYYKKKVKEIFNLGIQYEKLNQHVLSEEKEC